MIFRTIILSLALVASGALSAKVTEEESFSYGLDDGGRLSVSNVNGSITIAGGTGDMVEIIAIKKADDQETLDGIEIKIRHSAESIVIETELPDSGKWFNRNGSNGQVTYQITTPANTNLDSIETVNGGVVISGVSASVVAESVNGDLDLTDLVSDASLSTVNGSIDAEFAVLEGQQKVKAETVNGRISLRLPADADVDVSADTLNGSISGKDFGLKADKGFVGSDLNGKIGSGSARLNLDTVNGSIKIRSK
jgi:DUF4097 and DUF4098 domain-containing protein YvlB